MNLLPFKKASKGFTLMELLIVISIISILAAVIGVNSLESGQKSRDAKRQGDLKTLQVAVELYKSKYGSYPDGCNGANQWSGQLGTDYECSSGSTQYIVDLAPEFIPVLPADKKLPSSDAGYIYSVNAAGTVYKIMAKNSVEIPLPASASAYLHPFKSCDNTAAISTDGASVGDTSASNSWCNTFQNTVLTTNNCHYNQSVYRSSYAVWGGIATCTGNCAFTQNTVEAKTEEIICKM